MGDIRRQIWCISRKLFARQKLNKVQLDDINKSEVVTVSFHKAPHMVILFEFICIWLISFKSLKVQTPCLIYLSVWRKLKLGTFIWYHLFHPDSAETQSLLDCIWKLIEPAEQLEEFSFWEKATDCFVIPYEDTKNIKTSKSFKMPWKREALWAYYHLAIWPLWNYQKNVMDKVHKTTLISTHKSISSIIKLIIE